MNFSSINLLSYKVTSSPLSELVGRALRDNSNLVINTINPHSYIESRSDRFFSEALRASDALIPDGSGIVFAARFLCGERLEKVAGYDLFVETLTQLNSLSSGGKVFLLGSTDEVLDMMTLRAARDFPNVRVAHYSPPFEPDFGEEEVERQADLINGFSPDVVFVGLTAPKQEKLIFRLQAKVGCSFLSGIGAVFDFYSGNVVRPKQIWVDLHLEWLVRFLGEPRRLWRRNFVSTPLFLWAVLKEKLRDNSEGC